MTLLDATGGDPFSRGPPDVRRPTGLLTDSDEAGSEVELALHWAAGWQPEVLH